MAPGLIDLGLRLSKMIPTGSENFASSEVTMDAPVWAQLLLVSMLLGVFAAAVSEDHDEKEKDLEKKVELVRVPAIAARLAVAAGLFGIHGAARAFSACLSDSGLNSSAMFPPTEADTDIPVWAQLLLVSLLLGV